MKDDEIRKAVREGYAKVAVQESSSCCGPATGCGCGSPQETVSQTIGYSGEELGSIPEGADLGLGCGNPTALASLKEGEVVLDLGSGAGIDCFLAANVVGQSGSVVGVDMTPEMLEKARSNALKGGFNNVEFRLGEIENLPVADNSVDVVISNCVINLSPNKDRVFKEAYRVLRPGGRVMVSDIVLLRELPAAIKDSIQAYVGCIAGATSKEEYLATLKAAGFQEVEVVGEVTTDGMWDSAVAGAVNAGLGVSQATLKEATASVVSIKVRAFKP